MSGQLWQQEIVTRVSDLEDKHISLATKFDKAFPGGDHEAHCRYHDELRERNAELRRLRIAIQEKTISGLFWALIVVVSYALWHEVQRVLGVKP